MGVAIGGVLVVSAGGALAARAAAVHNSADRALR
jgi:hypothetical protein